MVPFLDLFNESLEPNIQYEYEYIDGRNGYYVRALKDITRGEELFGSYSRGTDLVWTMLRHGYYNADKEEEY